MSRRGFLGRIGGAAVGLGLSGLPAPRGAAAARPIGYDPSLPWTKRMQLLLNMSRRRFIEERTAGFVSKGRRVPPVDAATAAKQWQRLMPKFVHTFQRYDYDLHSSHQIYSGDHVAYDPTGTQPLRTVAPNQAAIDAQQRALQSHERQKQAARAAQQQQQQPQQQQPQQQQEQPRRPVMPAYGRNARELPSRQTLESSQLVEALLDDARTQ
jgi:hypothetical protein